MEDIYSLHHDCINELSRIIFQSKISFALSCSLKAIQNCFFLPHCFRPNDNYTQDQISRFTHVKELYLINITKVTNLTMFRNLDSLAVYFYQFEFNIQDHTKLTYFSGYELNSTISKCVNLKILKSYYIKDIESLINLQFLECKFRKINSETFDFSLLSNLKGLDFVYDGKRKKSKISQKVILSSEVKLIYLMAEYVDFSNKLISGNKLIHVELDNVVNAIFSNLKNIEEMSLLSVENIMISHHENSFQNLFTLWTKENTLLKYYNMTNLTFLQIKNCRPNVNLSYLTSLQKLVFKYNTHCDINIVNLTNLTYLYFVNYIYRPSEVKINLPKNIVNLKFEQRKRCMNKTLFREILIETKNMKHLQKLAIRNTSSEEYKLDEINQSYLTKLIVHDCELKTFDHIINLKHLVLAKINGKNINMQSLSNLKKLTLKDSFNFSENELDKLRSLETLRLTGSMENIKFNNMKTITNLILDTYSGKEVQIDRFSKLKILKVQNFESFVALCRKKLPSSLTDVYIKINKESDRDLLRLRMEGINLHFIE